MTLSVSADAMIARPVEEVFAFLADFRHQPLLLPDIVYIEQISPGPIGLGTTFWQMQGERSQQFIDCEITDYTPHRRIAMHAVGMSLELDGIYELEAVDGGTRVTMIGTYYPRGFYRAFLPLTRRMLEIEYAASLERLAAHFAQQDAVSEG
jgi:hypothetical protein